MACVQYTVECILFTSVAVVVRQSHAFPGRHMQAGVFDMLYVCLSPTSWTANAWPGYRMIHYKQPRIIPFDVTTCMRFTVSQSLHISFVMVFLSCRGVPAKPNRSSDIQNHNLALSLHSLAVLLLQSFRFRHFTIEQDLESTLRVGTDAMLLGAWVQPGSAHRILDIGTGTGERAIIIVHQSISPTSSQMPCQIR